MRYLLKNRQSPHRGTLQTLVLPLLRGAKGDREDCRNKTILNKIPPISAIIKTILSTSLARCSHPHVVQVYEIFPEMAGNIELWCMVMELIDGIDLASHLEDNGILSEAKALPIVQQVGSALSCVHKQGFTHLDVKPQNIMIRTPPAPLAKGGEREISSLNKGGEISYSPLDKGGQGGAVYNKAQNHEATPCLRFRYLALRVIGVGGLSVVCCSICPAICGL